ncbi:MAG: glycosyl transferase, partial [Flavobacterium sp.]
MRKRNYRKIIIITLTVLSVIVLLGAVGFFAFRNTILDKAIAKITTKIDNDYNAKFAVKEASFNGFLGVEMQGITLVPKQADTL